MSSLSILPGSVIKANLAKFVQIKISNEVSQLINKKCLQCFRKKYSQSITPDQTQSYAYEYQFFKYVGDLHDMKSTDHNLKYNSLPNFSFESLCL